VGNQFIEDYLQFHIKFGFNCPKKFTIPDEETVRIRLNFLLEELTETATAFGYSLSFNKKFEKNKNLPVQPHGIVDGLIDLEYVLLGTAAFCGLLSKMAGYDFTYWEYGWTAVHTANMKKVRVDKINQSARDTLIDVRKPAGWAAPDLTEILK
jgi:predicted HAD superfamily Cof-like phosphohydrolase